MLVQFFYIMIGLIGLITAIIIITQHKNNWIINVYLIILLLLISIRFLLDPLFYFYENLKPSFSYTPFLSLIIPVIYLYFENITNNAKKQKKLKLLHFVFPILLGVINLLNNYYGFLGSYSLTLLNVVFAIYYLIYLISSYRLLKENVWNRKSQIIFINQQNNLLRKWTIFLFGIFVLLSFRLLATLLFDLIYDDYSGGQNFQWISGVIFLILFIKILITPEILFGYNALYKKINEQKKLDLSLNEIWILTEKINIKNQQDEILKVKIYNDLIKNLKNIERLAFEEKSFRRQKTSATEFAKNLGIPKSHVNFIFKYHCKITFTEFKNIIKIYDALQLIETGFLKLNTLDALAIKVGFSSYNPFFTSFKDVTGSTPQAYNKQIAEVNKLK